MPNWGEVQNEINLQIFQHQSMAQQSHDTVRLKLPNNLPITESIRHTIGIFTPTNARTWDLKYWKLKPNQTLQDLILTVHHCYMHAMMNTGAIKIIENHLGARLIKQQIMLTNPAPFNTMPPRQEVGTSTTS